MQITALPWRIGGVLLIALGMLLFEPDAPTVLQRLLLPLLFGLAAGLVTQNLLVVAITGAALGTLHTDLTSANWIDRWAYPTIAVISSLVLIGIYTMRLRRRIRDTHSERWESR